MNKYNFIFKKFESILLKICLVSIILLISFQFISNKNTISVFFDNQQYGIKETTEKGKLIIKLLNDRYKDVEILKNGKVIGDFSENDEVEFFVSSDDIIEVNGSKYLDKIGVKIVGVSKNIELPKLNSKVITSKSIEVIGKVKLK
ncbi:hypothetical protein [Dethiothermospora halolimnae]|uniref:hypothetical protein n=1 Tax=Dethiothermospora halolimnae TaxID=3114390 RepID=UPI003CCC2FA9